MPSGRPGSRSETMPLANTRPFRSDPYVLTSNTRISACTVSLT